MTTVETIDPPMPKKAQRRWFTFSLRTLLVLVAALAVLLMYLRSVMDWTTAASVSPGIIQVSCRAPSVLADASEPPFNETEFRIYKETQAALIKSTQVLQAVLRKPAIKGLVIVQRHKSNEIRWMQKHLVVDFLGDTEILKVTFTDGPAAERVAIINAVKDSYMEEIVNAERLERLRSKDLLDRLYRQGRKELVARTRDFHELRQKSGQSDVNEARKRLLQKQLDALADRRNRVQDRLHELELQSDLPAKEVQGTTSETDRKAERGAYERHLAQLDSSIEKLLETIGKLDTDSAEYESKRRELDALADSLRNLGRQLSVHNINLDENARTRVRNIEDASVQ